MAQACGVRDAGVVEALVAQGVTAESLAALVLVPLVAVAWADDQLSQTERLELLAHARELGLTPDSACERLLSAWMDSRPGDELLEAWLGYARLLAEALDPEQREIVEREILARAREVARADGGVLRIGRRISHAERQVIEELENALRGRE